MNVAWLPVIVVDIVGSALVLFLSAWSAFLARQLVRKKPDDIFRNYLFLFALVIIFFAVSRSVGHLLKQVLLLNGMETLWVQLSPFSGAVNSITFVVIFALGIYFYRFQKVYAEIDYYKNNLEEIVALRTNELQQAKHTLENILNNSNPINITTVNHDLLQANKAYYAIWPRTEEDSTLTKCYESRPGSYCDTADCPLKLIIAGQTEVTQEVSKNIRGELRDYIVTAKPYRDIDGQLIGMVESFQDITLRKQAERAMRESEERFRKIFESSPDPVILAKLEDGAIIDVNRVFEVATGITRREALGHNSETLGFWADPKMRGEFRERLQSEGKVDNYEATFRVMNGQVKIGLASARAIPIDNVPSILLVLRDITAEKAAESALIKMDQMKSEFISTAAHELSTPLSAMMGYTEFLRNPAAFGDFTAEQQQDFISEIYNNGDALCRIVEDLLDIGRIESGNPIPLVPQEFDFLDVLSKKVKSFRLHHSSHSFRLDLPEQVPQIVTWADPHRINQVLDNLLNNATKYSVAGKEISVKVCADEEGWKVIVKDQGIGMSPEQIERMFDKFYRADASDTAISGLGLGMNIVKQIVEAHGGTIRVESTTGRGTSGTSVIFSLPYTRRQRVPDEQ